MRPYLYIGPERLLDEPPLQHEDFRAAASPARREGDRVKTALVIAASFAAGLVFVVAAKSLFLNADQGKPEVQAAQR